MRTDEHREIEPLEHLEDFVDSQEVARLDEATTVRTYESGNRAIYGAYRDGGEAVADRLARVDVRTAAGAEARAVSATERTGPIGERWQARLLDEVNRSREVGLAETRYEFDALVVKEDQASRGDEVSIKWDQSNLIATSIAAAESQGLMTVRFESETLGKDQPHLAARREGDAWLLDVSDFRAQQEAAEGWKRLAADRVSAMFPESGSPDELASRMELLPSGRYERAVDDLALDCERLGARWSPEEIEAVKSGGVFGFTDPVTGRALVRWDGRPGEVSTVYHEMYHLGQLTSERGGSTDRGIPVSVMEGFAELDAQEAAGVWDKIGARSAHDVQGRRYEVLMTADDTQWTSVSNRREVITVWSGHRSYDAVVTGVTSPGGKRESIILRVGGSYPAAVQMARGIRAYVPDAVTREAMRTGDDTRLAAELDGQLGKGAYRAIVEALGDDVGAWQDKAKASEVAQLMAHRAEKSLRGR